MDKVVIIHGFDRSGTSAISRTLASMDRVELFMQPFNSGPIRKRMYELWDSDMASDSDKAFFQGLTQGEIDHEYIKSHWFFDHSTSQHFVDGHLHIIKTTINHFTVDWIKNDFPAIDQWAIWRNPMDILASLVRNDFIGDWYHDALKEITPTVNNHSIFEPYRSFLFELDNEIKMAAFLIAVRSHYLFDKIDGHNIIVYEDFVENPLKSLSHFTEKYSLDSGSINMVNNDLNVIGKNYDPGAKHTSVLKNEDMAFAYRVFNPLIALFNSKSR